MYKSISTATSVGIFSHMNPDGDAIGSSIALASYLQSIGKDFTVFYPGALSESLLFMIPEGLSSGIVCLDEMNLRDTASRIAACDLLIGVDFNTMERIGGLSPLFQKSKAKKLLIDHHVGPQRECFDIVESRVNVSSACEVVFNILMSFPDVADNPSNLPLSCLTALMTGMTTDTNNFANSVYPSTLEMASRLLNAGVDRDAIIDNLFFRYPERRIKAEGAALSSLLKITRKGVAYMVMTAAFQEHYLLQEGDTEGFVNIPLSIGSVRMSILLKQELSGNRVRVSIRSKKGTSARDIAIKCFHGGGHELASGGKLTIGEDIPDISAAEDYIRRVTREFFKER